MGEPQNVWKDACDGRFGDGDCGFASLGKAVGQSVSELRQLVSIQTGEQQLQLYHNEPQMSSCSYRRGTHWPQQNLIGNCAARR